MADVQDFFANYLPNKLTENPTLAGEINAVYQFDIEGAGTWNVDLTTGDGGKVSEGPHDEPGCTVTCVEEDFQKLLSDPTAGMTLFMMGKLKVSNPPLALSLQKLLG